MASPQPNIPLSAVLPSPYQLIYGILVLVPSIPVTFAGAFLTLDRTRSFVPSNLATSAKKTQVALRFEGGIGGVLGGWLFGVHLSTLLALAIMNETSAKQLGSIQFLVIWLLSGVLLSFVAARWRLAAVLLIGLGGGAAFSLFVTVVCHPQKIARVILLSVCSTISAILCLLPIPNIRHVALRSAGAWLGAMGTIVSISVLSRVSDWANAWTRLWVDWDSQWGTSQEKGLSAAFIIMAVLGIATDWFLKRQFGECPDEKWDNYLANYAANLPNAHDRPGNFSPSVPFWKRIFNPPPKEPIAFPPDKALISSRTQLSPPPYQQGKLRSMSKKSRPWSGNSFQPLNKKDNLGFSSDSGSSDEDEHVDANGRYIPRPWAKRKNTGATSLSGVTLTDTHSVSLSKGKGKGLNSEKGEDVIYSDGESAISMATKKKSDRNAPGWTPEFIKRRSDQTTNPLLKDVEAGDVGLENKRNKAMERQPTNSPPPGAVPMTPSLMRALDRVSQAQNDAYAGIISKGHTPHASSVGHQPAASLGGSSTPGGIPPVQMPTPGGGYNWGVFWKSVEEKAKEADSPSSSNQNKPPSKPPR